MGFKRCGQSTGDGKELPLALRQAKFVVRWMALVLVEMKNAFNEMLLDDGGLAVEKPLGNVEKGQILEAFVVITGQLEDAEEEGPADFQIVFLQQMNEQNEGLLPHFRRRISQTSRHLVKHLKSKNFARFVFFISS